jgi:trehalose synthase
MLDINQYKSIVGASVIDELYLLSEKLQGRSIQNINSTSVGGGVAEILTRMIPLLKQLNVNTSWEVLRGDERFFAITKDFHNALHGVEVDFKRDDFDYFVEINRRNAQIIDLTGDIIFIHDPQPIALIEQRKEIGRNWIWRCHIDFTQPQPDIMGFLRGFIKQYDLAVFSAPAFSRNVGVPQVQITPSIDPLSDKNKELDENTINKVLQKLEIEKNKPIITQISRFDYLKDPIGVIYAYQKVKKHIDCQLILAGGGATDDPEGMKVLEEVRAAAHNDPDIHILFLPPGSDIEINALQRASDIVIQKSLKEGFGLTVTEALWKEKPVIASAVGGIPLQIKHGYSGILTYSIDGTAHQIKKLLNEPDLARKMGMRAKEHVRENFLITKHIRNYLLLFLSLTNDGDITYL